jgi:hypothetical protein
MVRLRAWTIRLVVSGEDGLPLRKGMRSCLAGQRLSAWRSTISQRRVTMTTISSLDAKKASAKLPLFASSFEFAHPDGSSRRVARGGKSITMGLSTSQRCWLTTSARFLGRLSGRHLKLTLRGSAVSEVETAPIGPGLFHSGVCACRGGFQTRPYAHPAWPGVLLGATLPDVAGAPSGYVGVGSQRLTD